MTVSTPNANWLGALCGCLIAWPVLVFAQTAVDAAPQKGSIPDFSGLWQHGVTQIVFHPPPEGGPGPVIDIDDVACTPNCPPRQGGGVYIGDPTNPILTPETAEMVRAVGDRWRADQSVFAGTELCAPMGVPNVLSLFDPVQILQSPEMVTILYQRDHQVRFVYMNSGHSAALQPSWYGDSIGHYEGDTLVVDTVGLNEKSVIDRFGAPQTVNTRVVERYRMIEGGNALLAHVHVDDPTTFITPWSGTITYNRNDTATMLQEFVCAENNKDAATAGNYPIPFDATPDF